MATRNLSTRFDSLRARRRRSNSYVAPGSLGPDDGPLLANEESTVISVGLAHSLAPEWVDVVEAIQRDITDIKTNQRKLSNLHVARLKITFMGEEEAKQQAQIEVVTAEISRLFRDAENGIKRIATIGNAKGTNLPLQERQVRLNVMRGLAVEIQDLSKQFRAQQKDFVLRLKGQEEVGSHLFGADDKEATTTLTEMLDRDSLSSDAQMQLTDIQQRGTMREKEIAQLVQSISELAQIWRELNVLVIDQGTILDRIDYNIEAASQSVKKGNEELTKAEKSGRHMRSLICMFILVVVIVILSVILYYKHK